MLIRNLRGYAALDLEIGPGPQLVWGPNAAGKTTILEAIVLLALGHSHRTAADFELIRWGADYFRVEGVMAAAPATPASRVPGESGEMARVAEGAPPGVALEVTLQAGGRKRIQVNGVPRRPAALTEHIRAVLFAPEEMLLVIGPPSLRRAALDGLTAPHDPALRLERRHIHSRSAAAQQPVAGDPGG